jgi:hypothetical protein
VINGKGKGQFSSVSFVVIYHMIETECIMVFGGIAPFSHHKELDFMEIII